MKLLQLVSTSLCLLLCVGAPARALDDAALIHRGHKRLAALAQGGIDPAEVAPAVRILIDLELLRGEHTGFLNPTPGSPAIAGSPVAGLTNVGDGAIGGVRVHDRNATTETWTVQCVNIVDGVSRWRVTGGESGVQQQRADAGVPYWSDGREVGFFISEGATAFIVGDTFSIDTTAAAGEQEADAAARNAARRRLDRLP